MKSKDFYRHSDTGKVYAVERYWSGGIVSGTGQLTEPLKNQPAFGANT